MGCQASQYVSMRLEYAILIASIVSSTCQDLGDLPSKCMQASQPGRRKRPPKGIRVHIAHKTWMRLIVSEPHLSILKSLLRILFIGCTGSLGKLGLGKPLFVFHIV